MNRSSTTVFQLTVALLSAVNGLVVFAQTPNSAFLGTRWSIPGPNNAVISPPTMGGTFGPGQATWSIVPDGTPTLMPPDGEHPMNATALEFDELLLGISPIRPIFLFQQALTTWQVGSLNFWSNMGFVIDGGGDIGDNVFLSNIGDIRAAVIEWEEEMPPSSQFDYDVIAHGFPPDTLGALLYSGTIGGDIHFRPHKFGPDDIEGTLDDIDGGVEWVDDPMAGAGTVDLLTVMIHEVGHALGLDHNTGDPNSVMQPIYMGSRRSLSGTDKRNIRQLYGAAVPEPSSAVLLSLALCCVCGRRNASRSSS